MACRKTMSEINKQKWARMRLILEKLEEKPSMSKEIYELVCRGQPNKIVRRTVQNYMAELKALGLVKYDAEARVYQLTQTKRIFRSKHDYEIALKHAKHLVLSTPYNQRFDQMNPNATLDLMVFESERDVDNKCFVQHLRTGYFKVYALMEKYRELMDETGLSKIPSIPKFGFSGSAWAEQSHMAGVQENIPERDFEKQVLFERTPTKGNKLMIRVSPLFSDQAEYIYITKEKMQEIVDLRDLLVGRIYSIVNDVINGIPLRGYCKHCPERKITIKG